MQLNQYLERIDYHDGDPQPDLETLRKLQAAHVCRVPFENIDVQLGRKLTTDVAEAYNKIVVNRRGGWCYEQNGLFGWALSEIGFDVTRVAAGVMRHERGDVATANHLCLLVRFHETEQTYLTDVGFGGSLYQPIELREADYQQRPFKVGLRPLEHGQWRFWEDLGNGEFSYDFAPETADETAMAIRCEFLQSDPSSGFVLNLVTQLRTSEAHLSLRGRVFRVAKASGIKEHTIDNADELVKVLASEFSLDVPEVTDLWPRILARHEDLMAAKRLRR